MTYPIEVHWSVEDKAWIADVPALRHCMAHGSTVHDAVVEVEIAAEAWLDAARAAGRPVPGPSNRAVQLPPT
jgi:predicted RNase H-like HicB family nuclease